MATFESFVFSGTEWNDHTNFIMQGFDPGIAPKRWQWISGADSDGALPVEEAHFDNAEMTVRIRIAPQANMDAALAKIGTLVLALQECEKQALGSAATWTPAGSTKTLTAYIVGGEVTGIPQSLSGDDAGWFLRNPAPVVEMKLYRRPFLYGTEVTSAATVTADTNPVQTLTLASVTGDVPAEARLIVTDAATQSRRHVEWGLQQRYYDAATSLLIDSASLVTSGFAGTTMTRTGAFATNGVIRGTLTTTPLAICGTGNLAHVGTYRVKARVYPVIGTGTATDLKVRLSWKEGDGPLRSNDYTYPVAGTSAFSEVDLGLISIPEKALGTQRWTGQIEAYSTTVGDTIDVDYIELIPTGEGYGKARTSSALPTPATFSVRDEFDQTAGNLNAKTLPVGGTWATSGADATDLAVEVTGHTAQRATVSDVSGKTALAGTTAFTNFLGQIDLQVSRVDAFSGGSAESRLLMRYVDASNFADARVRLVGNGLALLNVETVIGGLGAFASSSFSTGVAAATWYSLRVYADAGGTLAAALFPRGTTPSGWMVMGSTSSAATGGTLASGKVGFYDLNSSSTAVTRNYDNFWAAVVTPDATVFSGRSAEIRYDSAIRQDSTGTYYGPVATYRGSRFYIPAAGSANRTSRIFVKTRRNDIDLSADDQIADSTTVAINYTPRYWAAPR